MAALQFGLNIDLFFLMNWWFNVFYDKQQNKHWQYWQDLKRPIHHSIGHRPSKSISY